MAFSLVRTPEAESARTAVIAANKTKSKLAKGPVRLTFGDEVFVFEAGLLVEYEFKLPPELQDYPTNPVEKEYYK